MLVLAAGVLGFTWHLSAEYTKRGAYADSRASQYASGTERRIQRACAGSQGDALTKCIAEQIAASREDQRTEYDLQAQQDSAQAAFWTTVFGGLALVVTGIALWFVKRTLDATLMAVKEGENATAAAVAASIAGREANQLTRDAQARARHDAKWSAREARQRQIVADERAQAALDIAQSNADAAAAQVKVAQDTAEKQLRPYLLFTPISTKPVAIAGGHDIYEIEFRVLNVGQNPARIIRSEIGREYAETPHDDFHKIGFRPSGNSGDIIPKGDSIALIALIAHISSAALIDVDAYDRKFGKFVQAKAKVEYRGMADADDVLYTLERGRTISFRHVPDDGHTGAHLVPATAKNYAYDRAD